MTALALAGVACGDLVPLAGGPGGDGRTPGGPCPGEGGVILEEEFEDLFCWTAEGAEGAITLEEGGGVRLVADAAGGRPTLETALPPNVGLPLVLRLTVRLDAPKEVGPDADALPGLRIDWTADGWTVSLHLSDRDVRAVGAADGTSLTLLPVQEPLSAPGDHNLAVRWREEGLVVWEGTGGLPDGAEPRATGGFSATRDGLALWLQAEETPVEAELRRLSVAHGPE